MFLFPNVHFAASLGPLLRHASCDSETCSVLTSATPMCMGTFSRISVELTLILRRSRTGTVWFYTSTRNKRAARTKLYTKSLTRDLKRMYSRLTLVRISIKL